jgi:hypothetical protein
MSDKCEQFLLLMMVASPILVLAIYVTVADWCNKLRRKPPVTFGLDQSWFQVDPQKLREWRELNRKRGGHG